MIKIPNNLTFRLIARYTSAFIGFLGLAFIGLYFSIQGILNHRMDEDLLEDIAEFQLLYQSGQLDKIKAEIDRETSSGNSDTVFYRVLDQQGKVIHSSNRSSWKGLKTNTNILVALNKEDKPILLSDQYETQEYATRMVYGKLGSGLILHTGESIEQSEEIMELITSIFAVMFVLVIPMAAAVGWWVTMQAVRGINAVRSAAKGIEEGKLNQQVKVTDQADEIQDLADTFNAMASRIRMLIAEMREMIDNIAHDLRSPLGRIRAISESAIRGDGSAAQYRTAAEDTLLECDRLIQLINTTLDVAEAEAGVGLGEKEDIDLCKLTRDACEIFEPVAEQKSIRLSVRLENQCHFYGNKTNLQRMLANIVDNALKYTPTNGKISIQLAKSKSDIRIDVVDTGIGIPKQEQSRVFDRFYRCDQSRSSEGCGLGLSFARAVARAHGGDITLNSNPGKSIFSIIFPQSLFIAC